MNYFPNEATITGQSSKRNYHLNCSGNCPNGRVKMHIIDMDQKCGTLKRHIGLLRDLGKRKTIYIYGIPYFWQCAWCFLIYFASLKSHKSSKKYCKLIDFITFTWRKRSIHSLTSYFIEEFLYAKYSVRSWGYSVHRWIPLLSSCVCLYSWGANIKQTITQLMIYL